MESSAPDTPPERLPIRVTAGKDAATGIDRTRWAWGRRVAAARLQLEPDVRVVAEGKPPAEVARAFGILERAVASLIGSRPGATPGRLETEIPIEVLEDHCVLIGVSIDREAGAAPSIQVALDMVRLGSDDEADAVAHLGSLAAAYCFQRLSGADTRASLHALLDRYLSLSASKRIQILDLLSREGIDSHGVLRTFLRSVTDPDVLFEVEGAGHHPLDQVPTKNVKQWIRALSGGKRAGRLLSRIERAAHRHGDHTGIIRLQGLIASAREADGADWGAAVRRFLIEVVRWRDRWVAWLLGQSRIDLPYDGERVLELLETPYEDVDEKRALINQAVGETYTATLEGQNIERLSAWSLENDVRLVGGRLSRAFGNQAHLLSAAKLLVDRGELRRLARQLESATADIAALSSHSTRISLLAGSVEAVPVAQMVGAIDLAEEALIEHLRRISRSRVAGKSAHIQSGLLADLLPQADPVSEVEGRAGAVRSLLDDLRAAVERAEKRDAAYVVFLQRLHPAETIGLANANGCREVHPGKEEDLRDLVRLGGHNFYSSPGSGKTTVGARVTDVHWISRVGDWIEAIPLFIKETVVRRPAGERSDGGEIETIETAVDQEAMEAFFRAHAEYWALNIEDMMASEHVGLARRIFAECVAASEAISDEDGVRNLVQENPKAAEAVAALAAVIAMDFGDRAAEVNRLTETEDVTRAEALERVLRQDGSTRVHGVLAAGPRDASSVMKACESAARRRRELRATRRRAEEMLPVVGRKVRALPSLHILTTESAGMTEGYVQSWLEEEMALFNVVRGEGLEEAVADRVRRYGETIQGVGRKVIAELGMDVVVQEVMAQQKVNEAAAVMNVIHSYRPVAEEVARLAVLIDTAGSGRRSRRTTVKDPPMVERYLREHGNSLERAALPQVVRNNGRAIEERIEAFLSRNPRVRRETAERRVVESEPDFRSEWESLIRSLARCELLARLGRKRPELGLDARARNYLRDHTQLARSTARKAVIAERGLQPLTLHPRYLYQATGGNKRYHLLYTPSRVNLGERERDSVARWRQWVGGADDAAARHGLRFYSLINEGGVEERPAVPIAEVQKTSENALCVTHFAGSNSLALLIHSVQEGDIEDMADQMNLREDRMVPPAGEGYGGYCVPKDGLFLAFVLSLSSEVKLRQMGIPEHLHDGVMRLARKALKRRSEFPTSLDWQLWASSHLVEAKALRRFFRVRNGVPVFQITKVARAIENLGEPWHEVAEGPALVANLSARWGVQRMIINAEQVNRFMTFHKAWMIYQALEEARRHHDGVAADRDARVALTAEYKPVQDVRFSTGMRLFEMLARTGDHLTHCLDEEGQNLVHLMFEGFDPDTEHLVGRRTFRALCRQYGVSPKDRAAIDRFRSMFPRHDPPADIVMTSVTMSSTQDMLYYTSDTRLDQIADAVQVRLNDLGLTQEQITANAQVYGGDLRRWAGLQDLPAERLESAVREIGGDIHALVLKLRGPGRDYQKDVQGADVLNTGIPFPELLDLIQDPPKLVALMQTGNPNSALAITDGAAGRTHRALTERDVMAFFAACEKAGRRGVYRAVGMGSRNIERLRREMAHERKRALDLLQALEAAAVAPETDRDAAARRALATYAAIVDGIREREEAVRALREEERLRRYRKWRPRDGYVSRALAGIAEGLPLRSLDVATWLAGIGGWLAVMGEDAARIEELYDAVRSGVAKVAERERSRAAADGESRPSPFPEEDEEKVITALVRPRYVPEIQGFVQEMLVETSSKAVEVAAIEALERRRALRARAARAQALTERESGFREAWRALEGRPFGEALASARRELDVIRDSAGRTERSRGEKQAEAVRRAANTAFGRFLAATRGALESLARGTFPRDPSRRHHQHLDRFLNDCATIFTGREVVLEDWKRLAGGYEDVGGIARLAEATGHDRTRLDRVAEGIELFYATFCLGQTLEFALAPAEEVDPGLFWKRITDFFAETINDHFYPYTPWAYSRGAGFIRFSEEDIYRLAVKRHRWLYRYLRWLLTRKTELREVPPGEQDALLGNFLDGKRVVPLGADAPDPVEQEWRAYNQLREAAFIRNDGFQLPPVFAEFDPAIIDAENRTNMLFLYPAGRTHISRALREGPMLNRELTGRGGRGVNLLVSRYETFGSVEGGRAEAIRIRSAHLYLSEEEFREGLVRHGGLSRGEARQRAAEERGRGRLTDKGIRAAACFTRAGRPAPVVAASVIPFHGHPLYESGALEDHGLPATSQSLIFTDITYDKSLYPDIYKPDSGVELPAEIDWKASTTAALSEAAAKSEIESGSPGGGFPGLRRFAEQHPILLIKGAAESGARNLKVFDVTGDGQVNEGALQDAVSFVYDVSKRQNVVIQEALLTSPEFWASEALMRSFVNRQILEWNRPVQRNQYPRSHIYGSLRIIAASSHPERPYDLAFPITLCSLQVATNVGRGGTLDILLPECVQEEHREAILQGLRAQAPKVMEACARFARRYESTFQRARGRAAGADLRGVPYAWPPYLMLDFLVSPVFARPGRLVDIEPRYNAAGERVGSRPILEDAGGRFEGRIVDWRFIHLEPNVGIGLWDRFNLREEVHERRRAEEERRPFNWDNVGQSDRIVLRNFVKAGEEYLEALFRGARRRDSTQG